MFVVLFVKFISAAFPGLPSPLFGFKVVSKNQGRGFGEFSPMQTKFAVLQVHMQDESNVKRLQR